jgi:hypothetical protein
MSALSKENYMRFARKLALLALSVCAVLAFAASSASAVSVVQESTGAACSGSVVESTAVESEATVTNSGAQVSCPIKGTATDLELGGIFGIMAVCDVDLEGFITNTGVARGNYTILNCLEGSNNVTKCTTAGERHVRANIKTQTSPTMWTGEADFCSVAFGITIMCIDVAMEVNELAGHNYNMVFVHSNKCPNAPNNSLDGTINLVIDAAHPKIELS